MSKSQHTQKYKKLLHALKAARLEAGMTQDEVAKRFGSHASFVSKCEAGERRIDVIELAQFCRLYKITVSDLLKLIGID